MRKQELKNYIAKVKKFNKCNNTLDVLNNVLIKDQYIITSNLDVTYKKFFKELDINLEVLIDLKFLEQIVKKTKSEYINLNEAGLIKIGDNKFDYNFDPNKEIDFISYDLKKPLNAGHLNDTTISYLKTATNFVSNDDLRPSMTGVNITNNMIYSTDARMCYFKKHTSSVENSLDNIIIPVDAINLLTDNTYILNECDEDPLRFSLINDNEEVVFRGIYGEYPNIEAIIPKDNFIQINTIKNDFLEQISFAEISANKHTKKIQLKLNGDNVLIKSSDEDFVRGYTGIMKNTTHNYNEDFSIYLNAGFMTKISKFLNEDIKINASAPNRAVILNDTFLVMPLLK